MDTLTLAELATWFGAGAGLAVVPYAAFFAVRAVWRGVAMIGEDGVSNEREKP